MGTVESSKIKPRRREGNSKLNAKPPGTKARGVGSGSGRGLGGTCRADSPSARRLERARGAGEAGPAAEAERRSRATTRPGYVLSAAAPCAQVGSPPKPRSGRRSRCPKSRDRGSVAAGRPSLPDPAGRPQMLLPAGLVGLQGASGALTETLALLLAHVALGQSTADPHTEIQRRLPAPNTRYRPSASLLATP